VSMVVRGLKRKRGRVQGKERLVLVLPIDLLVGPPGQRESGLATADQSIKGIRRGGVA